MRLFTLTLCASIAALPTIAIAQAGAGASEPSAEEDRGREGVEIVGHVLKPVPLEWSAERMERLALPPGFALNVFARDLKNARMMQVAEDGTLYLISLVSSPQDQERRLANSTRPNSCPISFRRS